MKRASGLVYNCDRTRRGRGKTVFGMLAASAAMLAALSACAVRPVPLSEEETAFRIEADRARLEANRPEFHGPLTLHRAMAHALLHNLDARVRAMEHELALGQMRLSRFALLPRLSAGYGITSRSNAQASSNRSLLTGRESLSASTSVDDTRRTASLTAVWHALDFGVSYFSAKQQSDRALIAHEHRRKAVQSVIQDVRRAWWRAVAAERARARFDPLIERVRAALVDSARIAELQVDSPLEALHHQRSLLEALHALEAEHRAGELARFELAERIGIAPGTSFRIAVPPELSPEPRSLAVSITELETRALAYRPELREEQLAERIAAGEVKKALLRMLPGLELDAGVHADSNSFLVNHRWASLAARVSVNLSDIFSAPAALGAARSERALARARREALAMAVLTQLHVAVAEFESARARYVTASQIAKTQARITQVLRSSRRLGLADELRVIRSELDSLQARIGQDLAYAKVEESFGRIFAVAGADIMPDAAGTLTLESVAEAISAAEAAWMRGEVAMRPYAEEHAGGDRNGAEERESAETVVH